MLLASLWIILVFSLLDWDCHAMKTDAGEKCLHLKRISVTASPLFGPRSHKNRENINIRKGTFQLL